MTADELAAMKMERMDEQIEMKKKLKSVLSEAQFQKWEENIQKKMEHKKRSHFKKHGNPDKN
jgi:hypothetical protein